MLFCWWSSSRCVIIPTSAFLFFSTPTSVSASFSPSTKKQKRRHHHHHSRPKPKPKPPTGGAVNRPVAYLPPHKLSLTPEERAAPPLTPVQRGREEVAALCAVLPEGSEDKAECEDALQYYERMASGEGEACSLAAAVEAEAAATTSSTSPSTSSASSPSRFADPSCADEKEVCFFFRLFLFSKRGLLSFAALPAFSPLPLRRNEKRLFHKTTHSFSFPLLTPPLNNDDDDDDNKSASSPSCGSSSTRTPSPAS